MNVFYMCCNTTKNYYSNINIFYENATSIFLCILLIARETEREKKQTVCVCARVCVRERVTMTCVEAERKGENNGENSTPKV